MDDELKIAERAFEADRTNTEAAQRYEAALLRAGRAEEVTKLYRLANECKRTWEQLEPSSAAAVMSALSSLSGLSGVPGGSLFGGKDFLSITRDLQNRRYCTECKEYVFRVANIGEFLSAVQRKQCVSIQSRMFDEATDALRSEGALSFARGKGKALPCVVPEVGPSLTQPEFSFTMGRTTND